MTKTESLRKRSAANEVYRQLRDEIVRGALRPNERIVEAELAERLDVSRTPIREGLQRLADHGLIVSRRRGWNVREHTAEEIVNTYQIRMALEGMAARLAAENADDALLDRLYALQHGTEETRLAQASAREELVRVNDEFHTAVYEAAANPQLLALIKSNREFYFDYRIAGLYTDQEAAASLRGHDRIMAALRAGDGDEAEAATRDHLSEALEVTLSKLHAL